RDKGGEEHPGAWDAPLVETLEDIWQLAVPGHEELDGDQIDDGGVDSGEKKQAERNADREAKRMSDRRTECATDKNFSHVTQHVVAHAFRPGRVNVAVCDLQSTECVHRESKERGENADLHHHPKKRGCGSLAHVS